MSFDHDRHVNEDTEILNVPNEEVCYAETRCGPWDVQFNRARPPNAYEHLTSQSAEFQIRGPLIDGDHSGGQHIVREGDDGPLDFEDMHEILEVCGGWDYMELAESH